MMMEPILLSIQEGIHSALQTSLTRIEDANGHAFSPDAMLELTLPDIAHGSEKGLGSVPKEVLEKCLQPVMRGLQSFDANSLLHMKQVEHGAPLAPGVCVEGIHQHVEPKQEHGTVRYIHITENPGQFTMGIFVFPPHGRIPLHDHPEMCVMSRVLYGNLDRLSLDLVPEKTIEHDESPSPPRKSSWSFPFGSSSKTPKSTTTSSSDRAGLPPGSRRVLRNRVDHLVAPDCTSLFPYEGNLHEFVAGPNGAAVLDVLLPPYDGEKERDCTFYLIREDKSLAPINGRQPSWIIPTGQPEDFHCISGWYRGLGVNEEDGDEDGDGDESV